MGFLAAVAAVILGSLTRGKVDITQAAILCASSVTTAFIAALTLGQPKRHMDRNAERTEQWICCPLSLCPVQVWWWWRLLSDPGKWESTQIMWLRPSLPAWETSSLCICLRGSAACFSATEVRRFLMCVKALKCWCNYIRHKQQITNVCFTSLNVYSNQFRTLFIYRHVVPSSYCLWNLPASDTSLDCYCTSLSSYQTGPEIWLVSCHLSNVHQQVSQHLSQRPDPNCVITQMWKNQPSQTSQTNIILSSSQYRWPNFGYDSEQPRLWRYGCVHTSNQRWVLLWLRIEEETVFHMSIMEEIHYFPLSMQVQAGIWWQSRPAECPHSSTTGVLLEISH